MTINRCKTITAIILASVAQMTPSAFAGAESGGGGNAVVCRDSNGKILSAELLDLYEARELFGLNVPRTATPYLEQYVSMYDRVLNAVENPIEPYTVNTGLPEKPILPTLLAPGVAINGPIADIGTTVIPQGCKLEALAYFDDVFMKLFVNSEIWTSLGETDRAALIVHENYYVNLRSYGEKTSDRTRYQVGWIASDAKLVNLFTGAPQGVKPKICEAEPLQVGVGPSGFQFYMYYDSATSYYQIYYTTFDNLPLISQTSMGFTGPNYIFDPSLAPGITDHSAPVDSKMGPRNQVAFITRPEPNSKVMQLHLDVQDGFFPHDGYVDAIVTCFEVN